MCTAILLHRPGYLWPLLLAANRDELLSRPWQPPAEHWPDLPGVVAGRDTLAGGTWLGINRAGVVAAVLNRTGSLGPAAGKNSRGDLPLVALRHATAQAAAVTLTGLDGSLWRSFNLVVADRAAAFFVRGLGDGPVEIQVLPPGLHMVTASDPNDMSHPRVARHLRRFQAADPPEPPDWNAWPALLADSEGPAEAALHVPPLSLPSGVFGTASSSLVGVGPCRRFVFLAGGVATEMPLK